ncbi:MAG: hypothetical protein WBG50_17615 [Desulfomonilaceae bacterium]
MIKRSVAFFLFQTGDLIHAPQNHISTVIADPERFGLTKEEIRAVYAKHSHRALENSVAEIFKHGMLPLIEAFGILLHGNQPLPERFDYAESRMRSLGESGISEILWLHDWTEYPLWTRFSREGLVVLGIFEEFQRRVSKKKSKGEKYVVVCDFARGVLSQI